MAVSGWTDSQEANPAYQINSQAHPACSRSADPGLGLLPPVFLINSGSSGPLPVSAPLGEAMLTWPCSHTRGAILTQRPDNQLVASRPYHSTVSSGGPRSIGVGLWRLCGSLHQTVG